MVCPIKRTAKDVEQNSPILNHVFTSLAKGKMHFNGFVKPRYYEITLKDFQGQKSR